MSAPHSPKTEEAAAERLQEIHVGSYVKVGLMSAVFTCLTVASSFLTHGNMLVALLIAAANAAMIAWYTMHLNAEKGSIYRTVFLCLFFVADLILVTLLAFEDRIHL